MHQDPENTPSDRARLAQELAEVRAQMKRCPASRPRLEFRAAELAVRIELLDARAHPRASPVLRREV